MSSKPALIYDLEAPWKSDRTALYAESLLETFVEVFGRGASLPAIFQFVDDLLARLAWQSERVDFGTMYRHSSCDICSTCPRNRANGSSSCSELKLSSPVSDIAGLGFVVHCRLGGRRECGITDYCS